MSLPKDKLVNLLGISTRMTEFPGKSVWNQVIKDSGMFEDDYLIQCCDPVTISELLTRLLEAEKGIEELFAHHYQWNCPQWDGKRCCCEFDDRCGTLETYQNKYGTTKP